MIQFKKLTIQDKEIYDKTAKNIAINGCERSFANLFLWGEVEFALLENHLVFMAKFSKTIYPFPLGEGDKKPVLDAIILDAKKRGIPLEISSVYQSEKEILQNLYCDSFEFVYDRDWSDYVYDIEDLSSLAGKKYHKKRNHLTNFKKAHPNYRVEPISKDNLSTVKQMVEKWYVERQKQAPELNFDYEKKVFAKSMDNFDQLGLEGLILFNGQEVLGVTFASRLSSDTIDVHFEKADATVNGAYVAINNEFAKYIKSKYPEIKFLNREDDMGLEGLRKAKESYYPHHLVDKYRAVLRRK